ncbi:MAG: Mov34/MPN/PAD-1 family protein [archaeon]|nr:Mov34/MPN/PAD-1 family protein [Candidatus Bathyarchaeum sp.]
MSKEIFIEQSVIGSILSYAQMFHPKESILLLKGKTDRKKIVINDLQIPPLATHGYSFSGFPLSRLPIDFSVIGVAHSHPSGVLRPSTTDLNQFYGKIMMITGYPYQTREHIVLLDRKGNQLDYSVL